MSKTAKPKGTTATPAVENLRDEDLDKVVGGAPLPYPNVGGGGSSGGGKSVNLGSSGSTANAGTTKDVVSGKSTGKSSFTTSSITVMAEGGPTSFTGDVTTSNATDNKD